MTRRGRLKLIFLVGLGGWSACFGLQPVQRAARPLGQRWQMVTGDIPARGFPISHPKFNPPPPSLVSSVLFTQEFRAHLVLWTGTESVNPPETGANCYKVLDEVPWRVVHSWNVAWAGGMATFNRQAATTIGAIGAPVPHAPSVRASATGVEISSPSIFERDSIYDASR